VDSTPFDSRVGFSNDGEMKTPLTLVFPLIFLGFGACGDAATPTPDVTPDVTADASADVAEPCGGCAEGKACCPSRFQGDVDRCVDLNLNPENCGTCGIYCDGACDGGECIAAETCEAGTTCTSGQPCGQGPGQGRCCPAGTTFIASPADFFGCCPDGDICGCRDGMCPISQRAAKKDIAYLTEAEVTALGQELLSTRLASYRYREAPTSHLQLGFIIDDGVPARGIAADGRHVDLYGYISSAVAALQGQARRMRSLETRLEGLETRLRVLEDAPARPVDSAR